MDETSSNAHMNSFVCLLLASLCPPATSNNLPMCVCVSVCNELIKNVALQLRYKCERLRACQRASAMRFSFCESKWLLLFNLNVHDKSNDLPFTILKSHSSLSFSRCVECCILKMVFSLFSFDPNILIPAVFRFAMTKTKAEERMPSF